MGAWLDEHLSYTPEVWFESGSLPNQPVQSLQAMRRNSVSIYVFADGYSHRYAFLPTCRTRIAFVLTPSAVDLFCGAGGTTQGLRDGGYAVLAAVENDQSAADTFAVNHPETLLYNRDIRFVQAPALARRLGLTHRRLDLLTACPPCQPFSTLGSGDARDPRNALVSSIWRFVEQLRPRAVVLENVPGLRTEPRFLRLIADLEDGFDLVEYVVQATDFGIPQNRRRMIVIAIEKSAYATLPEDLVSALPVEFDRTPRTAGDALRLACKIDPATDSAHRARSPQPMTIRRMRAVKQGGGRLQLPKELELACHTKLGGSSATSIYGRIDPAKPAPTMTTRCTTPSCGRFVHPEEDRGLTLREAALLQTFPASYEFEGSYGAIERQIGNAVPVRLAHALGLLVRDLLGEAEDAEHDGVHKAPSAVPAQAA